jgi:hypothetical protein
MMDGLPDEREFWLMLRHLSGREFMIGLRHGRRQVVMHTAYEVIQMIYIDA